MFETIDYQKDAEGIVTLTIDLKDRSMNVLTPQFTSDLAQAIERIAGDDGVRGALITSAKDSFLAGADLKGFGALFALASEDAPSAYEQARGFSLILRRMETCGKPFAVAINGTALGGGLEICLACHYRVAANAPKAVLGLPEVQVGLLPGAGGTQRLPRLIGIEASLPLMLQGKHVAPAKAGELGIVHRVVEPGEEVAAARQWLLESPDAEQPWDKKGFKVPGGAGAMHPRAAQTFMVGAAMVAKETRHNYPAPIAILSSVFEGTIVPMDTALKIESRYFTKLLADPVAKNMVRTLFVNKQKADKLAYRPADVPQLRVQKLGILGAGMMGAGIAYVSAMAGQQVVLLDTSEEAARKGKGYSEKLLTKAVERGKMPRDKADAILARIHPTTSYDELAGCELVIEAVFESRAIKAEVTAKAEAVLGEDAIFASNTSTLPITGLAEASRRPERFIGLHFFSPVDKMPLVEVIVGEKTSEATIAQALDYVAAIRKTPIVVNDSRGFYTSRVFGIFTNEGIAMLAEGVSPALIENAAKFAGMPVGPLAVTDEVTLELGWKVAEQTRADLGEQYEPQAGEPVIRKFVEELDRKGKRFGKGFYDYPADAPKHLWPGLAEVYPLAEEQPDPEYVAKRLLYIQALETARCMEEGVVTRAEDGDIGSIFGWGFPPHTGGTLSFIDTIGIKKFVKECERMARRHGKRFRPSKWLKERAKRGEPFHSQ
ncbi:MAG: enoyl-CoA hydratase/isomerase family protein [Gammaproteobacteria bacterium]|nr:enoyl-CoA hydratase/isomerase family protein [Gammaproteobacteria bacterium]